MTGRTHDLAAFTALGVVVLTVAPAPVTLGTVLVAVLGNLIGGITPDIDEPTAPLWRNLPIGGTVGKITDKMLGGHRFLTHSLLGLALFGGLAYEFLHFIAPIIPTINIMFVWYAFLIGMLSHLVMDTFTKEGVPWLLPLPYKFGFPPLKELRITTGKMVETLGVFPALLVFNLYWYWVHYGRLLELIKLYLRK
ncbi:MAG: metal-dependent hydrolase [Candidatus Saccharimonadia bacterium]